MTYGSILEASMAVYGMVKFQSLSAIKLGFATQIFVYILYATLSTQGSLHENSTSILESWTNQVILHRNISFRPKYFTRKLKALRPLKTYVGSFYFVTKETLFNVVDSVLDLTTTLLLM